MHRALAVLLGGGKTFSPSDGIAKTGLVSLYTPASTELLSLGVNFNTEQ